MRLPFSVFRHVQTVSFHHGRIQMISLVAVQKRRRWLAVWDMECEPNVNAAYGPINLCRKMTIWWALTFITQSDRHQSPYTVRQCHLEWTYKWLLLSHSLQEYFGLSELIVGSDQAATSPLYHYIYHNKLCLAWHWWEKLFRIAYNIKKNSHNLKNKRFVSCTILILDTEAKIGDGTVLMQVYKCAVIYIGQAGWEWYTVEE